MGQIYCVSNVLPLMESNRSGHIVFVSSPAGFRGLPNAGIYGVTKSAITFLAIPPEIPPICNVVYGGLNTEFSFCLFSSCLCRRAPFHRHFRL